MRDGWREFEFSEFLTPVRRKAEIDPQAHYKMVTLPLYGRGARLRKIVKGAELGSSKFEVRTGDLMISKIDARKGSNSLLPESLDGAVVTGDFLSYKVDEDLVTLDFFDIIVRSPMFSDLCDTVSAGTTNRVRLDVSRFLALRIPLPLLAEQQRIVDLIGSLDEAIEAADQAHRAFQAAAVALRADSFKNWLGVYLTVPAGEAFEVLLGRQKSVAQSTGDHVIPYLRAGNIMDGSLSLDEVFTMNFSPKEQAKYCLAPGDVLVVEGGSIGQTARWQGDIDGAIGFDKHVLRIRGQAGMSTTGFAFQWARWCYESGTFADAATGATIKALGFSRAKQIPVPTLPIELQTSGVGHLESADEATTHSRGYFEELRNLRTNLLTALLSGAHEIPESYQRPTNGSSVSGLVL